MKLKSFLIASLLLIFSFKITASIISIAPLQIYSEEVLFYSGNEIAQKIAQGIFYLDFTGGRAGKVSNLLDASSFCEEEGVEYLIYGFLKNDRGRNTIELRLYNHGSRIIETVFYASDNTIQQDRLVLDIKSKINNYLIEKLGLYEKIDDSNLQGILTIPITVGYWIPLDGFWGGVTVSLFSVRSGILFNPFTDILKTENWSLNFHFGFSILYEMALNKYDVESFYLHKIKMLLPLELCLNLTNRHKFSMVISPLYQLDILDKRRNYSDPSVNFSSSFGFSTGLAYHYKFNDFFSAGISGFFDFTFYETLQVNFRTEISLLIHSRSIKKEVHNNE